MLRRFMRWAKTQGLIKGPLDINQTTLRQCPLDPEWQRVVDLAAGIIGRDYIETIAYFRRFVRFCMREGIRPAQVTPNTFIRFQEFLQNDIRPHRWRRSYKVVTNVYPKLASLGAVASVDPPVLEPIGNIKHKIPIEEWPKDLREQYLRYRNWSRAEIAPNRDRDPVRLITADLYQEVIQKYIGFLVNVSGLPLDNLSFAIPDSHDKKIWIFKEEYVFSYTNWLIQKKRKTEPIRLAFIAKIILRDYFQRENIRWLELLCKRVKRREEKLTAADGSRREELTLADLQKLEAYIEIFKREKAETWSKKKLATVVRDHLMVALERRTFLRQRNLREIKFEKNLYHDRQGILQVRFSGQEMKNGRPFDFEFPAAIVGLLEDYRTNYRPLLLQGKQSEYLFITEIVTRLECTQTWTRFRYWTEAALGIPFGPHRFRRILGTDLTRVNPQNSFLVGRVLGHREPGTTNNHYNLYGPREAIAEPERVNDFETSSVGI